MSQARKKSTLEKIAYPLVDIKFVLETLNDAKYFATLDLFKGFWQMPLAKGIRIVQFHHAVWDFPT